MNASFCSELLDCSFTLKLIFSGFHFRVNSMKSTTTYFSPIIVPPNVNVGALQPDPQRLSSGCMFSWCQIMTSTDPESHYNVSCRSPLLPPTFFSSFDPMNPTTAPKQCCSQAWSSVNWDNCVEWASGYSCHEQHWNSSETGRERSVWHVSQLWSRL